MDDRRLDELMTEYVESNKRDKERILRKFREKKEQIPQKRHGFSGFAIAACACALIAVIALSVFLPLVLDKNKSGEQAEDGRVALDYTIAYAEGCEAASLEYSEILKKLKDERRSDKLIIRSYDEYRAAGMPREKPYTDEGFFDEKALIVVFTFDTEYSHCPFLGAFKENDKVIVSVSKQKENVFAQTFYSKYLATSKINVTSLIDLVFTPFVYVHILEVDKKAVQNVNTVEVEIEYSKQLITSDNAVTDKIITEEDAQNIQYYLQQEYIAANGVIPDDVEAVPEDFVPAPKVPEELDDEMTTAVLRSYEDSVSQWLAIDFTRTLKGKIIYLGTYNGYIATTISIDVDLGDILALQVLPHVKSIFPDVFLCKAEE